MAAKTKKRQKIQITFESLTRDPNPTLPFVLLIANKILNIIGFADFIDRTVEWDSRYWKVSPGNLAKAVILVTFLKVRVPLFRIEKAFTGIDTEALFGKGVIPKHLNDDAIARALDRISEAKPDMNYQRRPLYVKPMLERNGSDLRNRIKRTCTMLRFDLMK